MKQKIILYCLLMAYFLACTPEKGDVGPKGTTGAVGDRGTAGVAGVTGAKGQTGQVGATGAVGAVGATGATGAAGATGATGASGAMGATGVTGAVGAMGATGTVGATGATGNTGAAGQYNQYTTGWQPTNWVVESDVTVSGARTLTISSTYEDPKITEQLLTKSLHQVYAFSFAKNIQLKLDAIDEYYRKIGADYFYLKMKPSVGKVQLIMSAKYAAGNSVSMKDSLNKDAIKLNFSSIY